MYNPKYLYSPKKKGGNMYNPKKKGGNMFFEMAAHVDVNKYKNYLVFDKDTHEPRLACTFGVDKYTEEQVGLEIGHFPILDVNCITLEMLKEFKYTHLAYTKGYDLENNISQVIDNHDMVVIDKKTIDDIIEKTYKLKLPQQVTNNYTNELYRNLKKDYFNEKLKELDCSMVLSGYRYIYPDEWVTNNTFDYLENIGRDETIRLANLTNRKVLVDRQTNMYIQIMPNRQTKISKEIFEFSSDIDTVYVNEDREFVILYRDGSYRKKYNVEVFSLEELEAITAYED